jgi:hypothetical protein
MGRKFEEGPWSVRAPDLVQCAGCREVMPDLGDAPAPGWAIITIRRYGKRGVRTSNMFICPKCSVRPALRQEPLPKIGVVR